VATGYLLYLDAYLHFTVLPDASAFGFDAEGTYPITQAQLSITHYLVNFVWPFSLQRVPVAPTVRTLQDPGVLIGLVCIVGTLICAWRLRHSQPLMAFCLLAYWIVQSPESSFVPMLHNASDFRPYPASPFLFLALALLLERYLKPALVTCVLLALILFFGAVSVAMNAMW
jgi:hypothetical protein